MVNGDNKFDNGRKLLMVDMKINNQEMIIRSLMDEN